MSLHLTINPFIGEGSELATSLVLLGLAAIPGAILLSVLAVRYLFPEEDDLAINPSVCAQCHREIKKPLEGQKELARKDQKKTKGEKDVSRH